nr:7462_t:CDS:2 [Entrophospora candida]
MSQTAKVTLVSALILTIGTVWGVHYLQRKEREFMHAGILREEEQKSKKENMEKNKLELEKQIMLQREYEQIQPVLKNNNNDNNTK